VSAGGAIRLAHEIAELAITAALEESDPDDCGTSMPTSTTPI